MSKIAFGYLKELSRRLVDANAAAAVGEDAPAGSSANADAHNDQPPFLLRQYEQLENMENKKKKELYKKSVLRYILNPATHILPPPRPLAKETILPFRFNASQKHAVEQALNETISCIQGPPGTGKTQTILNIIANVVAAGKTIAVVSNNNEAVNNVYAKLKQHELDFLCAVFGSTETTENFFANEYQGKRHKFWQYIATNITDKRVTKKQLAAEMKKIMRLLKLTNQVARWETELENFQTEYKHFAHARTHIENAHTTPPKTIARMRVHDILSLLANYESQLPSLQSKIAMVIFQIKMLFRYGILNFAFFNRSEACIATLQTLFYEKTIAELQARIHAAKQRLRKGDVEKVMDRYAQNSFHIFMRRMRKKYRGKKVYDFSTAYYLGDFDAFIHQHPVILCTNHSLMSRIAKGYVFDYLVMDEASQSDIVSAPLALACTKQAVIIGDTKQLSHVVVYENKKIADDIFRQYALPECYHYARNSILDFFANKYPDIKIALLNEHYRCHPKIIEFCNRKFYAGALISLNQTYADELPIKVIRTSEGTHAKYDDGKFLVNLREAEEVENWLHEDTGNYSKSIGIITPFRKQRDCLQSKIQHENIKIGTIHAFQGQEKQVIVLSTAVNNTTQNSFVNDPHMINVAVSRAQEKFILVTNGNDLSANLVTDFINYFEYIGGKSTPGKVNSIFDLLYNANYAKLLSFRKKHTSVSAYDSENLMNKIIAAVIREPYDYLERVLHYPLHMLIKDKSDLTPRELAFVNNQYAHVDFILFNKFNKAPVLVVEVDGFAYHANNPKQLQRDRLKDKILTKYGIPIIRFSTHASNEKGKLLRKLREVVK